jgi:multiple antibiotic resistance protein
MGILNLKSPIVAGIIMIVFLLWRRIIELNRIDVNSFAVAGSLCCSFTLEMIFRYVFTVMRSECLYCAISIPTYCWSRNNDNFTILTISVFNHTHCYCHILNIILVYIVLKSSSKIEKILERMGLSDPRKHFSTLAIAVKLFVMNVKGLFV